MDLDDWQQFVLREALGERPDGKWAAQTVALVVGRQNGKGAILEALELYHLFILKTELILHSAHEQKTATNHFRRMVKLINRVPQFKERIKPPIRGKGSEAIELIDGPMIFFATRTGGGGRGLTAALRVYDEAMHLSEDERNALTPTAAALSMAGTTQAWYVGSAVDQQNPKHDGIPFAQVRQAGIDRSDSVALFEWSIPGDDPAKVTEALASDPTMQAMANPGAGIRISFEWMEHERTVEMGARGYAVERLGVGDWPKPGIGGNQKISLEMWRQPELVDRQSKVNDPVCLCFDVTPDRSWASIGVAGDRDDGLGHLEMIDHRKTTNWLVGRLVDLTLEHDPVAIVWDTRSPANSLETKLRTALEDAGVRMTVGDHDLLIPVGSGDLAAACGMLFDEIDAQTIRHGDQVELADAIQGAVSRSTGDEAWVWSRKSSGVDISPLVAITLARWGHQTHQPRPREPMVAFR